MKTIVSVMLIALMAVASTMAYASHPRTQSSADTVAAFLWSSSSSYLNKGQHQIKSTLSSEEFVEAINILTTSSQPSSDNKLIELINRETYPEAVIMFVESEMRTDLFAKHSFQLSNLQKLMKKAYTSVEVPYILAPAYTSILTPALSSSNMVLARDESHKFEVFARDSNVVQVKIDNIVQYLETSDVFSNNKVDVIVVSFDWMSAVDLQSSLAEHDEIIAKVAAIAAKDTLFIYTADSVVPSSTLWTYSQPRQIVHVSMPRADDGNGTNPNASNQTIPHKINYFPGTFLEVLIVSAFLLAMVFSGGCALFGLQTPDRWDPPKQLKIKEI